MPCHVALQWTAEPPRRRFHTGVSLHSHTLHSKESLDFIYYKTRGIPPLAAVVRRGERRYEEINHAPLNLAKGWWTPPLAPHDAFKVERDQVQGLGLDAVVSITDHDNIEAPVSLQVLEECRNVPISTEWTVPFGPTFFHLGIHNLAPAEARMFYDEMEACRNNPDPDHIADVLAELAARPRTLIVFNHPYWDEPGLGRELHTEYMRAFLRTYGQYFHAMELNGLRPWSENRNVLALAASAGKPLISGGDRHTLEPAASVNLTNASTFSEFAEEVRAGWSDVILLNHYRKAHGLRLLHGVMDALRTYDRHPLGWKQWSDRVFYPCEDGRVRSLTDLFGQGTPLPVSVFLNAVRFASAPQVQWILNGAFSAGEEVIL